MYQPIAFIKRGFLTISSYPIALALQLLNTLITVASFYFLAKLVGFQQNHPLLERYGGNYMAFLLIGVIFQSFISVAHRSFSRAIRSEQNMGTLELLLMSKTPLPLILLYSALWSFLMTSVTTGIILLTAILMFDLHLSVNIASTLVVFVLAIISMTGIGMVSAGIIMITKEGDPVSWFISLLTGFLSGVYYPVEVFPRPLQKLALALPTTHALAALRQSLLNNPSLYQIQNEIIVLLGFSCLTIPLGIWMFVYGFNRARVAGSLSYY